jgi:hypothetical protein
MAGASPRADRAACKGAVVYALSGWPGSPAPLPPARAAARGEVQTVEESVRSDGAHARERVDGAEPLRSEEGGDPLLRDRRRGLGPDLVRIGGDHHVQGRAVGADVCGELPDLREEPLVAGPHRA